MQTRCDFCVIDFQSERLSFSTNQFKLEIIVSIVILFFFLQNLSHKFVCHFNSKIPSIPTLTAHFMSSQSVKTHKYSTIGVSQPTVSNRRQEINPRAFRIPIKWIILPPSQQLPRPSSAGRSNICLLLLYTQSVLEPIAEIQTLIPVRAPVLPSGAFLRKGRAPTLRGNFKFCKIQ